MSYPLVSVIIPSYNHEKFIKECIQSVINQSYQNIELIIIDDGSKDDSVEQIKEITSICKKRFTYFKFISRENRGLCNTLNEAISKCSGKYLSILASDDQMLVDKTSIQVEYMEKDDDIIALMGGVYWINNNSEILKTIPSKIKNYQFNDVFLLKHNLNVCTQMLRSSFVREIDGYPDTITIEDWYMWLKILENPKRKVMTLNKIFCKYRVHENNSINNGYYIYNGLLQIALFYDKHILFLDSIKQIRWRYVASLMLSNKKNGFFYFYKMFLNDFLSFFSKNFWRCVRNFFR